MGRHKREDTLEPEARLNLPARVKREKQAPDPYEVLRGPAQPEGEVIAPVVTDAAQAFERYCETLADTGDVALAVAHALQIDEQTARADLVELERRVIEAAPDLSMDRMLKRFRASEPIRLAILGRMLMHENPAVVLKAEERLSEIQGAAGQRRQGARAEDIIRLALQRIAEKNKKKKVS